MLSGYRFRAYPTASQAAVLQRWIGHQRFIYNAKVREAEYWRTFARHSLALTGQAPLPDQAYSQFVSEDTAFLREVPSQVLRNGAYRFATGCVRALKGLGGAPVIRKKQGRQSVLLTRELFEFIERVDADTGEVRHDLVLGTHSKPLGRLSFKAHRDYAPPKMLSISKEPDGRWYVSFCSEAPALPGHEVLRNPQELAYELGRLEREALEAVTLGLDRGVVKPVATSDGLDFDIDPVCRQRMARKERAAKRHQRRLARQLKGSRNRSKTRQRLARCQAYGREVRRDFAHKTSHALVTSSAQVLVFEDLKLRNITAAPAPKQDRQGRYTANGAAAKAGLNKALLANALGLVRQFATYKAAQRNKLVLSVNPRYSSQECAACGHVAAANRPSQAVFACVACGHTENADTNAAQVLRQRGITHLQQSLPAQKPKKTARVRRAKTSTVGVVRPEPDKTCACLTPVENTSDDLVSHANQAAMFSEAGNRHLNTARC